MKMKLIIGLCLCFLFCNRGFAQTTLPAINTTIKIGDPVPDYALTNLLNYSRSSVKLTDFNGKILILDFWNFTCTACIASWPKLLKLQEEFKDQVQIVLVNTEQPDTNKIKAFVQKREKSFGYKLNLLMANGDKYLQDLFPHYSLPHVVWIDKTGKVKYVTGGPELNEVTIKKILANDKMTLPTKTDERISADFANALFINGNGVGIDSGKNAIFTSIINPYTSDLLTFAEFHSNDELSYGYISNHTIVAMIRILLGNEWHEWGADKTAVSFPAARTVIEMADSAIIKDDITGSRNNRYTIQLRFTKKISINNLRKKMLKDIEQCFSLKTHFEKRVKKCLVLSRNSYPLTTYKDGPPNGLVSMMKMNVNNITVQELLNILGSHLGAFNVNLSRYPIIDETNFKGALGKIVAEGVNMNNISIVSDLLRKHGLEFSFQDREIDVLIIGDQNNH